MPYFKFAWTKIKLYIDLELDMTIFELYNKVVNSINQEINNNNISITNNININDIEIIYSENTEEGKAIEYFYDINNYINNIDNSLNWRNYILENDKNDARWRYTKNIFVKDYFVIPENNNCDNLSFYIRILSDLNNINLNDNTSICPICFESNFNNTRVFSCDHNYCNTCINSWITNCIDNSIVPTCPVCRNSIIRNNMDTYQVISTY